MRVEKVLKKRMAKYGLALHPDKTPPDSVRAARQENERKSGPGTFDFLGFTSSAAAD